jgi:hypothetical protein
MARNQQELLPGVPAFPILTTPENIIRRTHSHQSDLKPPILKSLQTFQQHTHNLFGRS